MSWSVEFIPFVPWPVFWAVAAAGLVLLSLLFWRSRRGAVLRALSFLLLLLAIANPHLKQEDREPLNDVVAVVVDDTQSQTIAGRTHRAEEIRKGETERLATKLAGLDDKSRAAVEALTKGIVRKLLHDPTVRLKDSAGTNRGERLADSVRELFDL